MAYVPIEEEEIETGEPVKATTQEKIRENFENHESRITSIEGGTAVTYPPIIFRVNGNYSTLVRDGILKTTLNFDLTITGVRILIDQAGSGGSTSIDLRYSRAGGSYVSVLNSNLTISSAAGDDALSDGAVLNLSEVGLQAGDILRLDLKGAQTNGRGFLVRVDYTA
jgi:hypothetical protein